jgi:hypothetical protein
MCARDQAIAAQALADRGDRRLAAKMIDQRGSRAHRNIRERLRRALALVVGAVRRQACAGNAEPHAAQDAAFVLLGEADHRF